MKNRLTYFGDLEDSRVGTIRGAIVFFPILIWVYCWNVFMFPGVSLKKLTICSLIISFMLSSAIGVQHKSKTIESVVYSALVFFVVYSCILGTLIVGGRHYTVAITVIAATLFGGLCGLLVNQGPQFKDEVP
jgi:hypothetical protein